MWRLRSRLALVVGTLMLGTAGLSCSKSDASANRGHSKSDKKPEQPQDEAGGIDLDDHSYPLLVWAAHTVQDEYFDKTRFDPREQFLSALTGMGLHLPEFFARPSADGASVTIKVRSSTAVFSLAELGSLDAAAQRLEEVLEFAQNILDLETEPLHELEYAAINGLFAPLDPHTVLLTPEEHTDLGVRTKGEFGGIGAQIRAEGRRIVVIKTLPGMPAALAGVEARDVIIRIDGRSTINMSAQEAMQLLRGPVGSNVAVKLKRGKKTVTLGITRNTIKIESVASQILPDGVAYVRITNFQENTAAQVTDALTQMGVAGGEAEGLVIDLRNNSGGLLKQATEIVDLLVPRGELVIVRSALGRESDAAQETVLVPASLPVVVLVDEQAASASEIVSGGLKALGRAVVVGRSSYGKGTVQLVRPFKPYGRELALKLTVAEYLVAGDRRIQDVGVVPDLELSPVELTSVPGIVRYFDGERFERERERSRAANLPSAKHDRQVVVGEAATRVRYLWTDEVPGALALAPDGTQRELPDEMRDPEVRIAREVALAARGAADGAARLDALTAAAARLSTDEDARIAAALRRNKVAWAASRGVADPVLTATARLTEPGAIPAGDPFVLRVEIANGGKIPAERVHVITDCVHDELDGIELMVGTIKPGEIAVRDLRLHVMPSHPDFTDKIVLEIHSGEPTGDPVTQADVMFEIAGAKRPALAYDYWIVDDPGLAPLAPQRPETDPIPGEPPFTVAGNGDGVLQPGERVLLAFVARNDGPGKSPDVRALLRNLTGGQGLIEEGLIPLGPLNPGASTSAAFGVTVGERADPALPFEVELIVGDATLRTRAQHKLRFRVLPTAASFVAGAQAVAIEGEAVRIYAGAHPSAHIVGEAPPGARLLFAGTIGDWRVLQTGDRRYFVPADLAALKPVASARGNDIDRVVARPAVLPPAVSLEDYPRMTSAPQVSLRGIVTHPGRVRDVVVFVRPPGPSQFDKKVHYSAAKGAAQEHGFEADIPLEPGGNRILIIARDGLKVERRRELWVYREP